MSIWYYEQHHQRTDSADTAYRMACVFCGTKLIRDQEDEQKVELYDSLNYGMSDKFTTTCMAVIGIYPACGWWKYGVGTPVGGMGSDRVLQPIMPLDLPVKVRSWELTVYPRSHIRR